MEKICSNCKYLRRFEDNQKHIERLERELQQLDRFRNGNFFQQLRYDDWGYRLKKEALNERKTEGNCFAMPKVVTKKLDDFCSLFEESEVTNG